jgi:uncharacterized protein YjhX (UPF0386 family)
MHRLPLKTINVIQNNTKIIKKDLTQQDIIDLNDTLLTRGVHELTIHSFAEGRVILKKFLDSLNCYSAIACLTADNFLLSDVADNLYNKMQEKQVLLYPEEKMHEFMLDHFYYDFLWIELTTALSQQTWFSFFVDALISFNFPTIMPIVVLRAVAQYHD